MKRLFIITMAFLLAGCAGKSNDNKQQVAEKQTVDNALLADSDGIGYVEALPEDFNEEDVFGLVLDYDYVMEVSAYPLHNENWIVTSHWCAEEEEGMAYEEDEDGNEVTYPYEDPFGGHAYPVVPSSKLSFNTRNYGGETINFYATSDGDEVLCKTDYKEITLRVLDADTQTRRLLVYSSPDDWCWGEPEDEWDAEYRHPFVELKGWIDEEWVCGNTVTTCP